MFVKKTACLLKCCAKIALKQIEFVFSFYFSQVKIKKYYLPINEKYTIIILYGKTRGDYVTVYVISLKKNIWRKATTF